MSSVNSNEEYRLTLRKLNREYLKELNLNYESPGVEDVVKLNSLISCLGVSAKSESLLDELIRRGMGEVPEKRTGNVGISVLYGEDFGLDMRTVAPTEKPFKPLNLYTLETPVKFIKKDDKIYLAVEKDDTIYPITRAEVISVPPAYNRALSSGMRYSKVIQLENDVLMGAIPTQEVKGRLYQGCCYKEDKCTFCALGWKEKQVTPKELSEIVETIRQERPNVSVTLIGGNTLQPDRGMVSYIPFISEIKKRNPGTVVEIEVSPPKDASLIDKAVDAGLDSFMSNMEVWDDEIRGSVCPGKSEIPKEEYFKAFRRAQRLGLSTYSVLIFGYEPLESYLEGIKILAENGITVIPLPFKPLPGAIDQYRDPTNPKKYLEACQAAIEIMRESKVNPMERNIGSCSLCGGCSVEVNLDRNWDRLGYH